MKKFLKLSIIIFCVLFTLSVSVFAAVWKWKNPQSIRVYIPQNHERASMVTKAFQEWQIKTKGKIRFQYVKDINLSQIDVVFIEKDLTDYCGSELAMGCSRQSYQNGEMHSKIFIVKRRPKGLLLSNTQVFAVMRHEIGHALGLNHCKNSKNIMFADTNLGIAIRQDIQKEDIQTLYDLYGFKD